MFDLAFTSISTLFQLHRGESSLIQYPCVTRIRCGRVVSVGDFETGCPGFDPQSRHYGHGGESLGNAHLLA